MEVCIIQGTDRIRKPPTSIIVRAGSTRSLIMNTRKKSDPVGAVSKKSLEEHSDETAHCCSKSSDLDAFSIPSKATAPTTEPITPTPPTSDVNSLALSASKKTERKRQSFSATGSWAKEIYATLPESVASELARKTTERSENNLKKSPFLNAHRDDLDKVPGFYMDEDFFRGDLLGEGGFAAVYDIRLIDADKRIPDHTPNQEYVVKHLSVRLAKDGDSKRKKLQLGAKDMVMESHFLASLDHPNILKLKGTSGDGISSFSTLQRTDAYFMILPKLTCTLEDKMSLWKRIYPVESYKEMRRSLPSLEGSNSTIESKDEHPHHDSFLRHVGLKPKMWMARRKYRRELKEEHRHQEQIFLCSRLQMIVDLLKALEYLHKRRIMHRDIKASNIGFDQDGVLKLFDLGLAKEIPAGSKLYHEESSRKEVPVLSYRDFASQYIYFGNTGTPRQMAPEVILRQAYDCKVDVFATSIVMWELLVLKKPYGLDVSGDYVKECVAIYNVRPSPIPQEWPSSLKKLIVRGWSQAASARPTSHAMRVSLESILEAEQQ